MPDHSNFRSGRYDRIVSIAFMTSIWLPLLVMLLPSNTQLTVENRELAKFPGVGGAKISRTQFENYLNDNLGFRSQFVRTHSVVKSKFRASNRRVIVGKNDWLFVRTPTTVRNYNGELVPQKEEIEKWRRTLAQRADYLAERDIHYGFIAVPDKPFIYPEYLPDAMTRKPGGSHAERLLTRLDQDFHVIQLFDELLAAKEAGELYYPRDTHWNGRGISAAYEAIIANVGQFVPEFASEQPCDHQVNVLHDQPHKNDLGRLIGSVSEAPVPKIYAVPRRPRARLVAVPERYIELEDYYSKHKRAVAIYENPSPRVKGRRLVMFHTSFSEGALRGLLAEHFERTIFIRHTPKHVLAFHKRIIEEANPMLVLNELPTRYLTRNPTVAYRVEEWNDTPRIAAQPNNRK